MREFRMKNRVLKFKNKLIFTIFFTTMIGTVFITFAEAEKWEKTELDIEATGVIIPEHEFIGYFDSNRIYTVVGAIKNYESFSVIPTIIINIEDEHKRISKVLEYVPISPSKELPFKIKFPEVKSSNPILNKPEIYFIASEKKSNPSEVIYDETLVQHDDGHLTGRVINNGNEPIHNLKIFAIIHGPEHETLDMAQNIEMIAKLDPGEIRNFSMYPDPSISSQVFYYSCFAVTDSFVRPVYSERNGEKFYFRYDSGTWYTDPQFNEKGTELFYVDA